MAKSGDSYWLGAFFSLISIAFFIWIAIIDRIFGPKGHTLLATVVSLGIVFGILFLSVAAISFFGKRRDKRREAKRKAVPCKHGIRGALFEPTLCPVCVHEREEQEKQAKLAVEQEAARRERERQARHQEHVRRIRLPEHLRSMHPGEFEHVVCDLFRRLGYEAEPTPISGDSGVDGYLRKDGALSILQCKRVKGSVGEPVLRDLYGTMQRNGAVEGFVVTTGKVSSQAREWAKGTPIRIVELLELVELIRTHFQEDEVVPENFQPTALPGELCPKCGKVLRTVNGRRGKFIGCSGYPTCRYTRSIRGAYRPRY